MRKEKSQGQGTEPAGSGIVLGGMGNGSADRLAASFCNLWPAPDLESMAFDRSNEPTGPSPSIIAHHPQAKIRPPYGGRPPSPPCVPTYFLDGQPARHRSAPLICSLAKVGFPPFAALRGERSLLRRVPSCNGLHRLSAIKPSCQEICRPTTRLTNDDPGFWTRPWLPNSILL